jgi:protein SCO1/2
MVRIPFLLFVVATLLTLSCERNSPGTAPLAAASATPTNRVYSARGVIINLNSNGAELEIKHDAIAGYMPAMTMPFDVKNTNELAGLAPGDPIAFRLTVTDTNGWIDQIQKLSSTNGVPITGPFRAVPDVEPLNVGDPLPDYHLTNQFGLPVSTAQFKGQALAITFLFTRCPYPTFCPLMANNFGRVQKKLGALPGAPSNWHLLTISFDPAFDTPAILKTYADAHGCNSNQWTFATGALPDITGLAQQLGCLFWHDDTGSISHNLRTAVLDPQGRIEKIFAGNTWTSDELVAELLKAASKK